LHECVAFLLPGIPVRLKSEKPELVLGDAIAGRLKRRRLMLRLSQVEAAAGLCVSEATVIEWEVRGTLPSDRHYPAIIRFLGEEPWPLPQTFGEHVRAERLRRGLSMSAAARVIGTDEENVRMWEAGAWRPTSRTFAKLETFLGPGTVGAAALAAAARPKSERPQDCR
jgi:DNA-binding transcriptional regulator YiaG